MTVQPKKQGVLLVGTFLSKYISARGVCEDLAEKLAMRGWKVYTTSSARTKIGRLLDMAYSCWRYRNYYRIAQIDVYSGPAFFWGETIALIMICLRKPYLLTLHGGNLPEFAQKHPGRISRFLELAQAVTTPSLYLFGAFRNIRSDLLLIPNPIEIGHYAFRLRSRPVPKLIWLRAFHEIYNPILALLVLDLLRRAFPDVTLTMIGPDKGDGSLQKTQAIVGRFDLQKNIHIVPGVSKNKVPDSLSQADIFINTTNVDNTPVSVIEAMACGLCVVSTNVGGIPYLLEDGQDALLVPPDDPEAMASAVQRILTEPGLAEKLSVNARRKVEGFDWSVILPQWERLFTELIQDA